MGARLIAACSGSLVTIRAAQDLTLTPSSIDDCMIMDKRIGAYLIGARGSIATTVAAGVLALGRGLTDPTGMITSTPVFDGLDLVVPRGCFF